MGKLSRSFHFTAALSLSLSSLLYSPPSLSGGAADGDQNLEPQAVACSEGKTSPVAAAARVQGILIFPAASLRPLFPPSRLHSVGRGCVATWG